jgi:hypothetical protein
MNFIHDDVNYDVGDGICDTNRVKIHTQFLKHNQQGVKF